MRRTHQGSSSAIARNVLRGLRPVAFLISGMLIGALQAHATLWPPPIRALTEDERVELAVSASHLIGVGEAESVADSLDREGTLWQWMVFQPRRWLKGDGGSRRVRVYFSQITDIGHRRIEAWTLPARCLVFVQRRADGLLVLLEVPDIPGDGILRLGAEGDTSQETVVLRGVARETPEAIARRSSLVVVGRTTPGLVNCEVNGHIARCAQVEVDSVIAGQLPRGPLRVHLSLRSGFESIPAVLLMLRPDGYGNYENVGFGGGVLRISGGRVEALGESVQSVVLRIRHAFGRPHDRR